MAKDSRGIPYSVTGVQELIQQMLIRLTVHKGKFSPDPNLGSRLYLLPGNSPAKLESMAGDYVREALADMREIQIDRVTARYSNNWDRLELTVWATCAGKILEGKTTL